MRIMIAKTDGVPGLDGIALAPGCFANVANTIVPITLDFDHQRVVGSASLNVEGESLYADIENADRFDGLYPALGFRATFYESEPGVRTIREAELVCVGLCVSPNADSRIPPIQIQK